MKPVEYNISFGRKKLKNMIRRKHATGMIFNRYVFQKNVDLVRVIE